MIWADVIQRQAGVAQDAGEQIIEIVGHAAGQHAQALQLLGLAKLLFDAAALGDVCVDFQDSGGLAATRSTYCPTARNVKLGAIFVGMDEFAFPVPGGGDLVLNARQRFGKLGFQEIVRNCAHHLFARPPIHALGAPIPKANRPIPIEREDAIVRHVEQLSLLAKALSAFAGFAGRLRGF